jgi:DNA-binding transcriptional LysR family regulator
MDLFPLRVFLTVASERSFSRAAAKLFRTQSAVSQSVRRLEAELKETLFDRTSKEGRLTEAGRVLKDYAEKILRLSDEAGAAVADLKSLKRGRVTIGANDAGVEALIPLVARLRERNKAIEFDVRRAATRHVGVEILQGTLDFGVATFAPIEAGLRSVVIGADELVVLTHPRHPFAGKKQVTMAEFGRQDVIAHNDPSPAREHVLRRFEEMRIPLNIRISLPSLDGVKRAVEQGLGVALLPRRCATMEIENRRLAATHIAHLRLPRDLRLVYRRARNYSNAALAFLGVAEEEHRGPRK